MKPAFIPLHLALLLFLFAHPHAHAFDCWGRAGHIHPNGGGFVADTAYVAPTVYLDEGVSVCQRAKIYGKVYISGFSQIYGRAAIIHEDWADDALIITGSAQIYGDAIVRGMPYIGNAEIYNHAQVLDFAKIDGGAQIYNHAVIKDWGHISGEAEIGGNAVVKDWGHVSGEASIIGNAVIEQGARVTGAAYISGDAVVSGNASVTAKAWIYGNARLSDAAQVLGPATIRGDVQIKGRGRVFGGPEICGNKVITSDVYNENMCSEGEPGYERPESREIYRSVSVEKTSTLHRINSELRYALGKRTRRRRSVRFDENGLLEEITKDAWRITHEKDNDRTDRARRFTFRLCEKRDDYM